MSMSCHVGNSAHTLYQLLIYLRQELQQILHCTMYEAVIIEKTALTSATFLNPITAQIGCVKFTKFITNTTRLYIDDNEL